jgi:hypothetical protein
MLTPEERFWLILAAGTRGDDVEQERLKATASRVTYSTQDYAPFARAFEELSLLIFIELLDMAAAYLDAFARDDDAEDLDGGDDHDGGEDACEDNSDSDDADRHRGRRPTGRRWLDIALATGYLLKARADGWKQFCERMAVRPFALWECLPGCKRLQIALGLAEGTPDLPGPAFEREGMIAWLNATRPKGEPRIRELGATPDFYRDSLEETFRERASWWGG